MILGLVDSQSQGDHVNRNRLDNRRCNLRACTPAENGRNKKARGGSQYHGVAFLYCTKGGKRYGPYITAGIFINGKRMYLGMFKTETEAALAYDAMARKYFGEFANLNFPNNSAAKAA
jgi:hypothetical protein